MTARRWAMLGALICVALWGGVFVGINELLAEVDPVQLVTLRFGIVAIAFISLLVLVPEWRPQIRREELGTVLLAGIAAVPAGQLTVMEAQRFLSPSIAAFVMAFAPGMTAALAAWLTDERITGRQLIGLIVALTGVATIVLLGAGSGAQQGASDPLRAAVIILAPAGWALYTILSKRLAVGRSSTGITGLCALVGTLTLLPFLPHTIAGIGQVSVSGWLWLFYLALAGTTGPWILWGLSLRALPASSTATFMYLVPLFALLWTAIVLGTLPTAVSLIGGGIVLIGVALTQFGTASR